MTYEELAATLLGLHPEGSTLVAVDGPGSAGKSTFSRKLADSILGSQLVTMDDLQGGGSGWQWQRLRDDVITPLRNNQIAEYAKYDWGARAISSEILSVEPQGIIIIEGLSSFRSELTDLYD